MFNYRSILLVMIALLMYVPLSAQNTFLVTYGVETGNTILQTNDTNCSQDSQLEQIKANLISNPPGTNNLVLREKTILTLDSILTNTEAGESQAVENFYNSMIEKMGVELQDTVVSGNNIWMMYNHGFVVKTPQITMAFDLVDGVTGYWSTLLSTELISSIDVLFISHIHSDHYDYSIREAVIANGAYVIVPAENSGQGDISMAAGDSLTLSGLKIKAHFGLHSVPSRIYEVITPDGCKFLHTGDNQTSTTLPNVNNLDVLLLNAWVNESGTTSAIVGMRNCLNKLNPTLMIPGHIQELGHNIAMRALYKWAFEVDDVPITSDVQVMVWGEKYHFLPEDVETMLPDSDPPLSKVFTLHKNYPNPFNPITTITYDLPRESDVMLSIYDITGRLVEMLVNQHQDAGDYTVDWDASQYSSGIYIYCMQTGNFIDTKKMVFMK